MKNIFWKLFKIYFLKNKPKKKKKKKSPLKGIYNKLYPRQMGDIQYLNYMQVGLQ